VARLPKDPSAVGSLKKASQTVRTGRETYTLTNITRERCLTDPNPLARRFTNFRGQYTDPQVPNVLSPSGIVDGVKRRDAGQLPED